MKEKWIEAEQMKRLTMDNLEEMGMFSLAHNCCYIDENGNTRYRDFEIDIDARELAKGLLKEMTEGKVSFESDEDFDDWMGCYIGEDGICTPRGLIATFYQNLWAMSELRDSGNEVDYVITLEELVQWMKKEGISITEKEPEQIAYRSREIAIADGLTDLLGAVKGIRRLSVSGMEQCREVLEELHPEDFENCFLEMYACSGGCVAGPSFQMKKGHYLADVLAVKNAAFGKDFHREQGDYELPGFELRKNFGYCSAQEQEEVSEEEIKDALAEMGKFSPKDELNCGACGYNTCREKAIAIIQNKAEVAMCIPYMRAKQESYSNKVFNAMPGLLVTVDYNLKIIQMNEAASKLFNMPKKRRLIGKPVSEIMDDYSLASILAFERNLMQDEIYLEDQKCYLDRVMTNDKENKMILCIMKDITKERKHKDQIHNAQIEAARMADKLVEEQLKIVQQIAGLLGETAADTKVAVEKLKNTILLESEEENEKK